MLSSASTTRRTGSSVMARRRQPEPQGRAMSGHARHLEPATDRLDPVAHSLEAAAATGACVEAGATILHADVEPAVRAGEHYFGAVGAGVLEHVGECFGHGEVGGGLDLRIEAAVASPCL